MNKNNNIAKKYISTHKLWFKAVAIGLIIAFLCNQLSYAIEPSPISKSPYTLLPESSFPSGDNVGPTSMLYVNRIISRVLNETGSLISARGLKTLISRHTSHLEDAADIRVDKEDDTFYLTFTPKEDGKKHRLKYYLSNDVPGQVVIEDVDAGTTTSFTQTQEIDSDLEYYQIDEIEIPVKGTKQEWKKTHYELKELIDSRVHLWGDGESAIESALTELALNIMDYGKGGTIKIYAGTNRSFEIAGVKIVAEDRGEGLPYDPNEWGKVSAERRQKEERGRGFDNIAIAPDWVTIEYKGETWVRDDIKMFKKTGRSDVSTGTRFTLGFNVIPIAVIDKLVELKPEKEPQQEKDAKINHAIERLNNSEILYEIAQALTVFSKSYEEQLASLEGKSVEFPRSGVYSDIFMEMREKGGFRGKRILEVGPAYGEFMYALEGISEAENLDMDIVGLGMDAEKAEVARSKGGLNVITGDITSVPKELEGEHFDCVVVRWPYFELYTANEIKDFIDGCYRMTRPGGWCVISTNYGGNLPGFHFIPEICRKAGYETKSKLDDSNALFLSMRRPEEGHEDPSEIRSPEEELFADVRSILPSQGEALEIALAKDIGPVEIVNFAKYLKNQDILDEGMRGYYFRVLLFSIIASTLGLRGYNLLKPLGDLLCMDVSESHRRGHAKEFETQATLFARGRSLPTAVVELAREIIELLEKERGDSHLRGMIRDLQDRVDYLAELSKHDGPSEDFGLFGAALPGIMLVETPSWEQYIYHTMIWAAGGVAGLAAIWHLYKHIHEQRVLRKNKQEIDNENNLALAGIAAVKVLRMDAEKKYMVVLPIIEAKKLSRKNRVKIAEALKGWSQHKGVPGVLYTGAVKLFIKELRGADSQELEGLYFVLSESGIEGWVILSHNDKIVKFMEIAPWNKKSLGRTRRYQGIKSEIMNFAKEKAVDFKDNEGLGIDKKRLKEEIADQRYIRDQHVGEYGFNTPPALVKRVREWARRILELVNELEYLFNWLLSAPSGKEEELLEKAQQTYQEAWDQADTIKNIDIETDEKGAIMHDVATPLQLFSLLLLGAHAENLKNIFNDFVRIKPILISLSKIKRIVFNKLTKRGIGNLTLDWEASISSVETSPEEERGMDAGEFHCDSLDSIRKNVIGCIFSSLGITEEDYSALKWKDKGDGFAAAKISLRNLNKRALREVFNIPADERLRGSVIVVNYGKETTPSLLCLKRGSAPTRVVNLSEYYHPFIDRETIRFIYGKASEIVGKATERTPFTFIYIYAMFDKNGKLVYLRDVKPSEEEIAEDGLSTLKIPVLPGVFGSPYGSSKLSAEITAEQAEPGKEVLVIGTGPGIEGIIAAKKGAKVTASDIKEMGVADTKLSANIAGVEIEVVNRYLLEGLGTYDFIIFNMPHYKSKAQNDKPGSPFEENIIDVEGKLLRQVLNNIEGHLKENGVAVIINDKSPETIKFVEEIIKENGTLTFKLAKTVESAQAYIIRRKTDKSKGKARIQEHIEKIIKERHLRDPADRMPKPVIIQGPKKVETEESKEAVERIKKFIKAIGKGKYQKGTKVDLRGLAKDKEIILIGDLHERLDNFGKILRHRELTVAGDEEVLGPSVREKVEKGEAVLVILGDAVHSDEHVNSKISLSMERSIDMMEQIMQLKIDNPDHVYYILGNHDDPDANCGKEYIEIEQDGSIKEGGVNQTRLYREKMIKMYGMNYLNLYRKYIDVSPIRLLADGLLGTHGGPPKDLSLDEIKTLSQEDIKKDFQEETFKSAMILWGRHESILTKVAPGGKANDLAKKGVYSSSDIERYKREVRQPDAIFIVAHTPHLIRPGRFYSEPEKNYFVIYGAGTCTGYVSYRNSNHEFYDVRKAVPTSKIKEVHLTEYYKKDSGIAWTVELDPFQIKRHVESMANKGVFFNAQIEGDKITLGYIQEDPDNGEINHASIIKPSSESPYTLRGWLEGPGEVSIALSPVSTDLIKLPNQWMRFYNGYVKLARFLIENGFPEDFKLTELTKNSFGILASKGRNKDNPQTLGALAALTPISEDKMPGKEKNEKPSGKDKGNKGPSATTCLALVGGIGLAALGVYLSSSGAGSQLAGILAMGVFAGTVLETKGKVGVRTASEKLLVEAYRIFGNKRWRILELRDRSGFAASTTIRTNQKHVAGWAKKGWIKPLKDSGYMFTKKGLKAVEKLYSVENTVEKYVTVKNPVVGLHQLSSGLVSNLVKYLEAQFQVSVYIELERNGESQSVLANGTKGILDLEIEHGDRVKVGIRDHAGYKKGTLRDLLTLVSKFLRDRDALEGITDIKEYYLKIDEMAATAGDPEKQLRFIGDQIKRLEDAYEEGARNIAEEAYKLKEALEKISRKISEEDEDLYYYLNHQRDNISDLITDIEENPDGSPLNMYRFLHYMMQDKLKKEEGVKAETIRLETKGRMPDGHLSIETVKRDLGVLVRLGLAEKTGKGKEAIYRATDLSPPEYIIVPRLLTELKARPTSQQQAKVKRELDEFRRTIKELVEYYRKNRGNPHNYINLALPELFDNIKDIEELRIASYLINKHISKKDKDPYGYVAYVLPVIFEKSEDMRTLSKWVNVIDAVPDVKQDVWEMSQIGALIRKSDTPRDLKEALDQEGHTALPEERVIRILTALGSFGHNTNVATGINSTANVLLSESQRLLKAVERNEKLSEFHEAMKKIAEENEKTGLTLSKLYKAAADEIDRVREGGRKFKDPEIFSWAVDVYSSYESLINTITELGRIKEDILRHLSPEEKEIFRTMEKAMERLVPTLDDRIALIAGSVSDGVLDLNALLEELFDELLITAAGNYREIFEIKKPKGPIWIKGNRRSIISLICNLADNCFKYIPEEGKVFIEAKIEGNKVIITVSDKGKGMSQETKEKIWEPFYTTSGTGIGLTESKLIAEDHGGTLEVFSATAEEGNNEETGTTFTVTLPMVVTEKNMEASISPEEALSMLANHTSYDAGERSALMGLTEEMLRRPVDRVMVVGAGLVHLPVILALTGKEVVFVDMDPYIISVYRRQANIIKENLDIKHIRAEIGSLDLKEVGLEAHSFDAITFIDLAGGPTTKGSPVEWLEKASELLKPEGYIVIDEDVDSVDPMTSYFKSVFPEHEVLAGGKYFWGAYSGYASRNRLYRVKNVQSNILKAATSLEAHQKAFLGVAGFSGEEEVQDVGGGYGIARVRITEENEEAVEQLLNYKGSNEHVQLLVDLKNRNPLALFYEHSEKDTPEIVFLYDRLTRFISSGESQCDRAISYFRDRFTVIPSIRFYFDKSNDVHIFPSVYAQGPGLRKYFSELKRLTANKKRVGIIGAGTGLDISEIWQVEGIEEIVATEIDPVSAANIRFTVSELIKKGGKHPKVSVYRQPTLEGLGKFDLLSFACPLAVTESVQVPSWLEQKFAEGRGVGITYDLEGRITKNVIAEAARHLDSGGDFFLLNHDVPEVRKWLKDNGFVYEVEKIGVSQAEKDIVLYTATKRSKEEKLAQDGEGNVRNLLGSNKWNISRSRTEYTKIMRLAGMEKELERALMDAGVYADIGCGIGQAGVGIADFCEKAGFPVKVYGIDMVAWGEKDVKDMQLPKDDDFSWEEFSRQKAEHEEKGTYAFIQGDVTDVEIPEKADVATMFFVLQYVKDPIKALLNIYNQMNVKGMIFATVIIPKGAQIEDDYAALLEELGQKYDAFAPRMTALPVDSQNAQGFMIVLQKTRDEKASTSMELVSSEQQNVIIKGESFDIRSPIYRNKSLEERSRLGEQDNTTRLYSFPGMFFDPAFHRRIWKDSVLAKFFRGFLLSLKQKLSSLKGDQKLKRPRELLEIEINEHLSDDDAARLKNKLVSLVRAVSHQGKKKDLRGALQLARKINPEFGKEFEDIKNADFDIITSFVHEASAKVLLPAGYLFSMHYQQVRLGEKIPEPNIFFAEIDEETWREERYLGRTSIWTVNIKWLQHPGKMIALTLGTYAFVDPSVAESDVRSMYKGVMDSISQDPICARILESWLRKAGVDEESYCRLFGRDRYFYEERQHARDNAFMELLFNVDSKLPEEGSRVAEAHIKRHQTPSQLEKAYEITLRDGGILAYLNHITAELVGQLGGIITEMEDHLKNGEKDLAYIAFLDFILFKMMQDNMGNEIKREQGQLPLSIETMDFFVAGLIAEYLSQKGISLYNAPLLKEFEKGPRHPAGRALKLIKEIYEANFYTEKERISLLSSNDNVTCGTICESEHREGVDAINRQLGAYYEELAKDLSTDENPVQTPLKSEQVIQALAELRGYDQGMLEEIRKYILDEIPEIKKKQIHLYFAIPPDGKTLWWVEDKYAGGHFGRKSIHISLPFILSQDDPKEAALAIARHDYNHLNHKGHIEDEGTRIVREQAKLLTAKKDTSLPGLKGHIGAAGLGTLDDAGPDSSASQLDIMETDKRLAGLFESLRDNCVKGIPEKTTESLKSIKKLIPDLTKQVEMVSIASAQASLFAMKAAGVLTTLTNVVTFMDQHHASITAMPAETKELAEEVVESIRILQNKLDSLENLENEKYTSSEELIVTLKNTKPAYRKDIIKKWLARLMQNSIFDGGQEIIKFFNHSGPARKKAIISVLMDLAVEESLTADHYNCNCGLHYSYVDMITMLPLSENLHQSVEMKVDIWIEKIRKDRYSDESIAECLPMEREMLDTEIYLLASIIVSDRGLETVYSGVIDMLASRETPEAPFRSRLNVMRHYAKNLYEKMMRSSGKTEHEDMFDLGEIKGRIIDEDPEKESAALKGTLELHRHSGGFHFIFLNVDGKGEEYVELGHLLLELPQDEESKAKFDLLVLDNFKGKGWGMRRQGLGKRVFTWMIDELKGQVPSVSFIMPTEGLLASVEKYLQKTEGVTLEACLQNDTWRNDLEASDISALLKEGANVGVRLKFDDDRLKGEQLRRAEIEALIKSEYPDTPEQHIEGIAQIAIKRDITDVEEIKKLCKEWEGKTGALRFRKGDKNENADIEKTGEVTDEYKRRIALLLERAIREGDCSRREIAAMLKQIRNLQNYKIFEFESVVKAPDVALMVKNNPKAKELFIASDVISGLMNYLPRGFNESVRDEEVYPSGVIAGLENYLTPGFNIDEGSEYILRLSRGLVDEYLLRPFLSEIIGKNKAILISQKLFPYNYPDKEKLAAQDSEKPYKGILGDSMKEIIDWKATEVNIAEVSDVEEIYAVNEVTCKENHNEKLRMTKDEIRKLVEKKVVYVIRVKGPKGNIIRGALFTGLFDTKGNIENVGKARIWDMLTTGSSATGPSDTRFFWWIAVPKARQDASTKNIRMGQVFAAKARVLLKDVPNIITFSPVPGYIKFKKVLRRKGLSKEIIDKYGIYLYLVFSREGGYDTYLKMIKKDKFVSPEEFFWAGKDKMLDLVGNFHCGHNHAPIAFILPRREGFTRPDSEYTVGYAYKGYMNETIVEFEEKLNSPELVRALSAEGTTRAWRERVFEKMKVLFAAVGFEISEVKFLFSGIIAGLDESLKAASDCMEGYDFRGKTITIPKEYMFAATKNFECTQGEAVKIILDEIAKNTDHIYPDDDAFIGIRRNEKTGNLEIVYYDNGEGDPLAVKNFGKRYTSTGREDRGYGLRLIKYLVDTMKGEVRFHSDTELGTYTTILIPLSDTQETPTDIKEPEIEPLIRSIYPDAIKQHIDLVVAIVRNRARRKQITGPEEVLKLYKKNRNRTGAAGISKDEETEPLIVKYIETKKQNSEENLKLFRKMKEINLDSGWDFHYENDELEAHIESEYLVGTRAAAEYHNDVGTRVITAHHNDRMVGYIWISSESKENDTSVYFYVASVRKEYQKRGVGTLLFNQAVKYFSGRGINRITFTVRADNNASIAFIDKQIASGNVKLDKITAELLDPGEEITSTGGTSIRDFADNMNEKHIKGTDRSLEEVEINVWVNRASKELPEETTEARKLVEQYMERGKQLFGVEKIEYEMMFSEEDIRRVAKSETETVLRYLGESEDAPEEDTIFADQLEAIRHGRMLYSSLSKRIIINFVRLREANRMSDLEGGIIHEVGESRLDKNKLSVSEVFERQIEHSIFMRFSNVTFDGIGDLISNIMGDMIIDDYIMRNYPNGQDFVKRRYVRQKRNYDNIFKETGDVFDLFKFAITCQAVYFGIDPDIFVDLEGNSSMREDAEEVARLVREALEEDRLTIKTRAYDDFVNIPQISQIFGKYMHEDGTKENWERELMKDRESLKNEDEPAEDSDQEAQDFIDAVINWIDARALETGVRGETLVIGIGTSWIPEMQRNLSSTQNLLSRIEDLSKSRLKGFKNIKVIIQDDPRFLAEKVWAARRGKDRKAPLTPLSNVIILEDEDVLEGELFRAFRGNDKERGAFFAKMQLPEDFNEISKKQEIERLDINIVKIVTEMLERASLPGAPREFYIELPDMIIYKSLHELSDVYAKREEAMIRA
ncbi:GNAT family N-acetyltransferase [Candidatus Omnitrophota bacterium]